MENDGMRFIEQESIGCRFAIGNPTASCFERPGTQTEIEAGTAVIFRPEQNDFRFTVAIGGTLIKYRKILIRGNIPVRL